MAVDPTRASAAMQVTGAIRQAAHATGASFDYLLATARLESNLNPTAQAATSSAKGLFQFIEQTWLATMKASGSALGYGAYADAISYNAASGRYDVADPAMRQAIMRLRGDPSASAAMAGAFTRNNAEQLSGALGRRPTDGELYIAHFLGADGAERLINAANSRPDASAAAMFPGAAQANRAIFYDRGGRARSAAEVYAVLANKLDSARMAAGASGVGDGGAGSYVQDALTDRLAPIPEAGAARRFARAVVPDTAAITQAYAQAGQNETDRALAPAAKARAAAAERPLFQAMFTSRGGQAVAPVVQALWQGTADGAGHPPRLPSYPTPVSAQPFPASGVNPLELFRDAGAGLRGILSDDV